MDWFLKVVKNYAGFQGRASRKEYWMYVLFYIIFAVAAMFVDRIMGTTGRMGYGGTIYMLFSLGLLIPSLAVSVRRLHDINYTGWLVLVGLIPLVGWIILLILMIKEGDSGSNKYGAVPKAS